MKAAGRLAGLAGRLAVCALLFASSVGGCDGAFHFVDGTGGSGGGVGGGSGGADGAAAGDGSPDAACNVACTPGSSCSLRAGAGCTAVCQGATCEIALTEHSSAVCQDGAQCTITCTEECAVTCADTSRCTVQCLGADAAVPVSSMFPCGN